MKYKLINIILFLLLISCVNENNKEITLTEEFGKYFTLQKDNIDVYFPKKLREYDLNSYKETILKIEDSLQQKFELERFNNLKFSNGNVYFFKGPNDTDICIKLMEYFPFTKNDSSKLAWLTSETCRQISYSPDKTCTKIKTAFSENSRTKVFVGKYKIEENDTITFYANIYAISSNLKTFIITIRTKDDINFNKYILKTRVK